LEVDELESDQPLLDLPGKTNRHGLFGHRADPFAGRAANGAVKVDRRHLVFQWRLVTTSWLRRRGGYLAAEGKDSDKYYGRYHRRPPISGAFDNRSS
jgi:hypothetical protein